MANENKNEINRRLLDQEETLSKYKRISDEVSSELFPATRKLMTEISADYQGSSGGDELIANEREMARTARTWNDADRQIRKKLVREIDDNQDELKQQRKEE
jgi:hypothetical protein